MEILKRWHNIEQLLVAGHGEVSIHIDLVVDGSTKEYTYELKFDIRFKCIAIEPEELTVLVESEHIIGRIKEFFYDQLKELLGDTSLVFSRLSCKLNFQRFVQIQILTYQRVQSILNYHISSYM